MTLFAAPFSKSSVLTQLHQRDGAFSKGSTPETVFESLCFHLRLRSFSVDDRENIRSHTALGPVKQFQQCFFDFLQLFDDVYKGKLAKIPERLDGKDLWFFLLNSGSLFRQSFS